jgi:putative flippase GtrA
MLGKEKIQMAKFALVGLLNTSVDFAIFLVFVYGIGIATLPAQIVSFGGGVVNSYWWNRKWTFQAAGGVRFDEMLRFAVLNGLSFTAATAVLLLLVQRLEWNEAAAKALSVFFSTAVNYAGSRYWVFRMERRHNRAG